MFRKDRERKKKRIPWGILIVVLAVIMIAGSRGPGNKNTRVADDMGSRVDQKEAGISEDQLLGTWKFDHGLYEGSSYSAQELYDLSDGDNDYNNFYFVCKEGGSVVSLINGELKTSTVDMTDQGYKLGDYVLQIEDGYLLFKDGAKMILCFEKISDEQDSSKLPKTETVKKEGKKEKKSEKDAEKKKNSKSSDSGIDPEFKEYMDTTEEFFDAYIEFLESYDASDLSMLTEYAQFMSKYADYMDKLDHIDEDELSTEELAYYTEVYSRILKKLSQIDY